MSFSATLFDVEDDPRKAEKTLSNGISVASIVPTEACDILNPTFILNYNSSYTTCNYIVVGAPFNRSYFITDMKIDIGKKIEIDCAVDVLQTYWDSIKECVACVTRNEGIGEPTYVPDDKLPLDSNQRELKTCLLEGGEVGVEPEDYTTGNHLLVCMV